MTDPTAGPPSAIAYIDGLNLYYGAVRRTDNKWLDISSWITSLLSGYDVAQIRYFTARIKQRDPSDRARDRQNIYLRALEADPLISVTYGHFRSDERWKAVAEHRDQKPSWRFRPPLVPEGPALRVIDDSIAARPGPFQEVCVVVEEEKGSDVNLGVHLVNDAVTGACETALVVTNDSDLEEAVRIASAHVEVVVLNPSQVATNARLLRHAARQITFDPQQLAGFRLPVAVKAANGRELHCPREWRKKPQDPPEAGLAGPSDDADG